MDKGMLNGLGERFARCAEHAGTVALYIGDRINRPAPSGLDGTPFQQLRRDLTEMRAIAEQMEQIYLAAPFEGEVKPIKIVIPDPPDPRKLAEGLNDWINEQHGLSYLRC